MVTPAVDGIDLFKIAGRSISGWLPSLKTGTASHIRQPFCSQLEERLLLWLEYHPQVVSYARGDIGTLFAKTYQLPTPKDAPSAKGTVEALFRWMTQRFEQRLPNTSYDVHDAKEAAEAGGMALEELERCFFQAIVGETAWEMTGVRV